MLLNLDKLFRKESTIFQGVLEEIVVSPEEKVRATTDLYQLENVLQSFKSDIKIYPNFDPAQYEKMMTLVHDTARRLNEHTLLTSLDTILGLVDKDDFPKLYGIPEKIKELITREQL